MKTLYLRVKAKCILHTKYKTVHKKACSEELKFFDDDDDALPGISVYNYLQLVAPFTVLHFL